MKCKKLKNLIFFLLAVACYFLLIRHVFTIKFNSKIDVLFFGLFAIFTIIFFNLENAFLHELGHLLFGLISGLKLVSIRILWLKLKFDNCFKIAIKKANSFGETVFIPKNDKNVSNKVAISIIGGLIATIFLLIKGVLSLDIIKIFMLEISNNFFEQIILLVEIIYAGGVVVPFYYLVVNLFGDETCDGRRLLSLLKVKSNNKKIASNAIYVGSLVYKGVQVVEIDPKYFEYYNEDYSIYSSMIIYYKYLSLISVDKEKAINTILKLSDTAKIKDSIFDAVISELYYVAYLKNDNIFLKNNKEIIERIVEYDNSLYALRAHAILRIYNGDIEWAKILIEQGLNGIEILKNDGTISVEKHLFEDLKTRLS